MPKFGTRNFDNYSIRLFGSSHNLIRTFDIFNIIPYFWDSNIKLDMMLEIINKRAGQNKLKTLAFEWKLVDSDGNRIKSGKGTYTFGWRRNKDIIKLGILKPYQSYELSIMFIDELGNETGYEPIGTFTIKDRDEMYVHLIIAFLAAVIAVIVGLAARGS